MTVLGDSPVLRDTSPMYAAVLFSVEGAHLLMSWPSVEACRLPLRQEQRLSLPRSQLRHRGTPQTCHHHRAAEHHALARNGPP